MTAKVQCVDPTNNGYILSAMNRTALANCFGKTNPGPNPGDGAPGYSVFFVSEEYFKDGPRTPSNQRPDMAGMVLPEALCGGNNPV